MDFKQIQELIKVINKSNIGELTIEEKDFKITIRQKEDPIPVYSTSTPVSYSQQQPQVQQQAPQFGNLIPPAQLPDAITKSEDHLIIIKSPMIGTFYRSATPDKPALVSVGDEITIGKPVGIVEAMKLFNEIDSEVKGIIVKVLIEDASPVEYDQPLFLVDPS